MCRIFADFMTTIYTQNMQNPSHSPASTTIKEWCAKFLAVALTYYVFARLGLLFAIPPGYSTAIWPASGVALAAALCWGKATYPGILLGSTLVNIHIGEQAVGEINASVAAIAVLIAIGSTLQAAIARWLICRYVPLPLQLNNDREIGTLMLLGGVVATTVAATIGTAVQIGFGILSFSNALLPWFTWWVGDAIGVIVFTPICLINIFQPKIHGLRRRLAIGLTMLSIFFAVTVAFNFLNRETEEKRLRQVEQLSQALEVELATRIQMTNQSLHALSMLHSSSDFVSHDEFMLFTDRITYFEPSIVSLGWIKKVSAEDKDGYTQWAREEVDSQYRIYDFRENRSRPSSGAQDYYFPITYAYPTSMQGVSLGLNMTSSPRMGPMLTKAAATNAMVSSTIYRRVINDQPGIVIGFPVYQGSEITPLSEAPLTHKNLQGFYYAIIQISDLIEMSLDHFKGDKNAIRVTLYDITDGEREASYQQTGGWLEHTIYRDINFVGRQWRLGVAPTPEYFLKFSFASSYFTLIGGMTLVGILGILVLSITGKHKAVETEVENKTFALKAALDEAEAANLAKSQFLANMSHELRTPLNAVIGFSHRLLRRHQTELPPSALDGLATIEKNGKHLLMLINDLLDMAKIEAGRIELHCEAVRFSELLGIIKDDFNEEFEQKGIEFILPPISNDFVFYADRQRLTQILFNLVSNAFKYTEEGSVSMWLEPATLEQRDGAWIHVKDTGIGISEEDLKQLFEKFQQASSRRIGTPGTGLGLAITRELALLHGGLVKAGSMLEQGSTFSVWLPGPKS